MCHEQEVRFSLQMSRYEWFDQLMKENELTNADFARKGGISESYVSKVRNQERSMGLDFCHAVSKVFHIPLQVVYEKAGLLQPDKKTDKEKKEFEEMNFKFSKLPIDEQKAIRDMIDFYLSKQEKLTAKPISKKSVTAQQ